MSKIGMKKDSVYLTAWNIDIMVLMKHKTKSTVETEKKIMAPLLLLTPGPQIESFS